MENYFGSTIRKWKNEWTSQVFFSCYF